MFPTAHTRSNYWTLRGSQAPAQLLGLGRQADPLIVGESHPPAAELLPEHSVLLTQTVDRVALLLMDPAGQRDQEERGGTAAAVRAGAWAQGIRARKRVTQEAERARGLNAGPDTTLRGLDRVLGHYRSRNASHERRKPDASVVPITTAAFYEFGAYNGWQVF